MILSSIWFLRILCKEGKNDSLEHLVPPHFVSTRHGQIPPCQRHSRPWRQNRSPSLVSLHSPSWSAHAWPLSQLEVRLDANEWLEAHCSYPKATPCLSTCYMPCCSEDPGQVQVLFGHARSKEEGRQNLGVRLTQLILGPNLAQW